MPALECAIQCPRCQEEVAQELAAFCPYCGHILIVDGRAAGPLNPYTCPPEPSPSGPSVIAAARVRTQAPREFPLAGPVLDAAVAGDRLALALSDRLHLIDLSSSVTSGELRHPFAAREYLGGNLMIAGRFVFEVHADRVIWHHYTAAHLTGSYRFMPELVNEPLLGALSREVVFDGERTLIIVLAGQSGLRVLLAYLSRGRHDLRPSFTERVFRFDKPRPLAFMTVDSRDMLYVLPLLNEDDTKIFFEFDLKSLARPNGEAVLTTSIAAGLPDFCQPRSLVSSRTRRLWHVYSVDGYSQLVWQDGEEWSQPESCGPVAVDPNVPLAEIPRRGKPRFDPDRRLAYFESTTYGLVTADFDKKLVTKHLPRVAQLLNIDENKIVYSMEHLWPAYGSLVGFLPDRSIGASSAYSACSITSPPNNGSSGFQVSKFGPMLSGDGKSDVPLYPARSLFCHDRLIAFGQEKLMVIPYHGKPLGK